MEKVGDNLEQNDDIFDDDDDDDFEERISPTLKTIPGLVYISFLPPKMTPLHLRQIFSKYGELGRIYLQPDGRKQKGKRKIKNTYSQGRYTEGWIEFADKKLAKQIVRTFHNTLMVDGKKGMFADYTWNLKYLHRFRWIHLTESLRQEQHTKKQRMNVEMSQAKREIEAFSINVEKSKNIAQIKKRHESKGRKWVEKGRPIRYKQRKTVEQLRLEKQQKMEIPLNNNENLQNAEINNSESFVDGKRKKVLGKIFGS